jgi:Electron transfer DM13
VNDLENKVPVAMRLMRPLGMVASHGIALLLGLGIGVYVLPILTAPAPPPAVEIASHVSRALYTTQFRRDLADSDLLHWGDATVSVGPSSIVFVGRLAPGPDYKLYLSPEFVETEAEFTRLKPRMVRVDDVRGFGNLIVPVPAAIDVTRFTTVIVWCESFGQFITAARYQ